LRRIAGEFRNRPKRLLVLLKTKKLSTILLDFVKRHEKNVILAKCIQ